MLRIRTFGQAAEAVHSGRFNCRAVDWTRARVVVGVVTAIGSIAIGTQAARGSGAAGSDSAKPDARAAAERSAPRPPRLPRNFQGQGSWIVRDLGITVPFRWQAENGDMRMVAGGRRYPIWFTNLIYHNTVYTLTYKWPGVTEHPCSQIPGFFNLFMLNQAFKTSRFVGREILVGNGNPRRRVNHWRVGLVWPQAPPGNFLRIGLALGDIYVDQGNRGRVWELLQFGVQNLYDPALDEWLRMDTFRHKPGRVGLPGRCPPPG